MLIVLLTDFGNRDWFVSVMKGVILKINPNVNVIDLSHEITPQNVKEAGFILWNAYKFFPRGQYSFALLTQPLEVRGKSSLLRQRNIFLSLQITGFWIWF
jgi:hypothetical protein